MNAHAVELNFINRSNEISNSDVVIIHKNLAAGAHEPVTAWKVIQNSARGDNHSFTYSNGITVCTSDCHGNATPQLPAQHGQLLQISNCTAGNTLRHVGLGTNPREIQVENALDRGEVNVNLYKDGKLLGQKLAIAPARRQKAVFEFGSTIWIGVVSHIKEGEPLDSATVSNLNTEISLLGIASADIVMTGGGPGRSSTPFQFSLENVRFA